MRAGVMSAGAFWRARTATEESQPKDVLAKDEDIRPFVPWSPERFATEQIRTLVRRVFSGNVTPPVRQVVFSAAEAGTDVFDLCRRVGAVVSEETLRDVAVVEDRTGRSEEGGYQTSVEVSSDSHRTPKAREVATRLRGNLWTLPFTANGRVGSTASLHRYLSEIRREFEYSVVAAAPCGESHEAICAAQFADGMILVLSAQFTRRVAALRIRNAMESADVRLLGTVLKDREFPIPEQIYRRL